MQLLETLPARKPTDTQAVCNLQKNPNDAKQYVIKIN
jgi:branched-chain amino acid transport system substrate-binding protein